MFLLVVELPPLGPGVVPAPAVLVVVPVVVDLPVLVFLFGYIPKFINYK